MDEAHVSFFQNILGDKGVLTPEDGIESYEQGWRGERGKAALVLRPASTDEVSKIVSYCAHNALAIIPQSGNTGLTGASVPDDSATQIILSLGRMNAIHDFDKINKSIHAEAGVRLSALNAALEDSALHLAIDLGADPCIGGMVATNTGGSRFLKYRGMRDHVLGLKAVLADEHGTIINALCPLHKNNTGFDITQIFIGTGGVFGIVTEISLRLSPLPQQSATALLVPKSAAHISDILNTIEHECGEYLSAFEGMSGESITRAIEHTPSLNSPFGQECVPDYAIMIELSRSWASRDAEQPLNDVLETVLSGLWEAHLDDALIGPPEKLWSLRHALSEGVQKSGTLFAFDLSFRRGQVMSFCDTMRESLKTAYPSLTLCDFGHIGDGAVHFNLVHNGSERVNEAELRQWVIGRATEAGGSYSAEHGVGPKNQIFYDLYTADEIKKTVRAIKTAISPANTSAIVV